jgi:hypothetical protein
MRVFSPPLVGGGQGEGELRHFATPTPTLPHHGGGNLRPLNKDTDPWLNICLDTPHNAT